LAIPPTLATSLKTASDDSIPSFENQTGHFCLFSDKYPQLTEFILFDKFKNRLLNYINLKTKSHEKVC